VSTRRWHGVFRFLTAEDHLFEWLQFGLYAAGAVGAALVAARTRRNGRRLIGWLWVAFAVGLFLTAGEEIAWGQRAFEFGTPDALDHINRQHESTAHNITATRVIFASVFFLIGVYGSVGSILIRRGYAARWPEVVQLVSPPLFFFSLFVIGPVYKVGRFVDSIGEGRGGSDYQEYVELCLALALASFAWLSVRRLRPTGRHRES
jgi:hypothetical protein